MGEQRVQAQRPQGVVVLVGHLPGLVHLQLTNIQLSDAVAGGVVDAHRVDAGLVVEVRLRDLQRVLGWIVEVTPHVQVPRGGGLRAVDGAAPVLVADARTDGGAVAHGVKVQQAQGSAGAVGRLAFA